MPIVTNECPYCSEILKIDRMRCDQCGVVIEASFPASRLGNLPTEHQRFIEMFVLAGGNLKEIASLTGVSYPTVRSRLNKIIEALREEISKTSQTKGTLLDAVSRDGAKAKSANGSAIEAGRLIKSI